MNERYRKALHLEYFTVGYNVLEAAASLVAGGMANSIALVGFGLDSIVESLSGLVLIWRLKKHGTMSAEEEERVERLASRFVGLTFFILGAYVLFESAKKIVTGEAAQPSPFGIVIALLSLVVMPVLAYQKFRLGKELGLRSLVADSKETLACSFLSVALLAGLLSTYFFDFHLADPLVGLIIVLFLFREGYELLLGDEGGE